MMADLFQRTRVDGAQVLHAGFEQTDFDYLLSKKEPFSNEIRIAHAGTIVVEKDFATLVTALNRARSQLSRPVLLEFFGPLSYQSRSWFDPTWMREHGDLPNQILSQRLRECHWGLAVMGLRDDDPRYNRFSFPTKFITCLAAGLPMIVHGHAQSSLITMAKEYQLGLLITDSNLPMIEQALLSTLAIQDLWSRFGNEIQRCGRNEFNADQMRRTLYQCFAICSGRSGDHK
jgi:hypothetical protein